MSTGLSRRELLRGAAAGAGLLAGLDPWAAMSAAQEAKRPAANERLRMLVVGVGNRGANNLAGVAGEEITTLCDVDKVILAKAGEKFPQAKRETDYRKALEKPDQFDAVVVSTPDHSHALPAMLAMKAGLPVYCEKPLAHSVAEVRAMRKAAADGKLVTQMGTQIHSGDNYRRVVELIRAGAIGSVREVHVWVGKTYFHKGSLDHPPVPATLDYDVWLGPAPHRPYSPAIVPFNWRKWWDFGGGGTSDMACHHMDLPHWALDLRLPERVSAQGSPVDPDSCAEWLVATFEYPARLAADGAELPPVKLTWYNGNKRPPQFDDAELKLPKWGDGTLFVGDRGLLLADYGRAVLLPEKDFAGYKPPAQSIPRSVGHYREWTDAIRARKSGADSSGTLCNFDYSGALAETVLLANVAYRAGEAFTYNGATGELSSAKAREFLSRPYRKGWELPA